MKSFLKYWLGWEGAWFLLIYFGFQLLFFVGAAVSFPDWRFAWNSPEYAQIREKFQHALLLLGAGLYGFSRLARSPAAIPAYLVWLRRSPWNYRLPLPLGPLHLVWSDAFRLGGLGLLARYHAGLDPLWPIVVFAITYHFVALRTLLHAAKPEAAALKFGFGALLLAYPDVEMMAAISAMMYAVCCVGLFRFLASIPCDNADAAAQRAKMFISVLGWPLGMLGPARQFASISYTAAGTTAALIGWWFYCVTAWLEAPIVPAAAIAVVLVAIMSLIRLVRYANGCGASMPLLARIGTGRLIVPRYDYAVLTPLAALASSLVIAFLASTREVAAPLGAALASGCGVFIVLAGGPSLRHWNLTCECRMGPSATSPARGRRYTGSA